MTTNHYILIALLAALMGASAFAIGSWAQSINPEGISPITDTVAAAGSSPQTRNAFMFGASIGLLGTGLLYCVIAMGLLIQAKSKGRSAGVTVYCVAGLALAGFVLSYVVDDYFY